MSELKENLFTKLRKKKPNKTKLNTGWGTCNSCMHSHTHICKATSMGSRAVDNRRAHDEITKAVRNYKRNVWTNGNEIGYPMLDEVLCCLQSAPSLFEVHAPSTANDCTSLVRNSEDQEWYTSHENKFKLKKLNPKFTEMIWQTADM